MTMRGSSYIIDGTCPFCTARGAPAPHRIVQFETEERSCLCCGSTLEKAPFSYGIPTIVAKASAALVESGPYRIHGVITGDYRLDSGVNEVLRFYGKDDSALKAIIMWQSVERTPSENESGEIYGAQHVSKTMPQVIMQTLKELSPLGFRITELPRTVKEAMYVRLELTVARTEHKSDLIRIELTWPGRVALG